MGVRVLGLPDQRCRGGHVKNVTLYTASRKVVAAHGAFIPFHRYFPDHVRSINSDDIFSASQVQVDQLPIQRFCYQDEGARLLEIFTAFDPVLQECIDVMKEESYRKGVNDGGEIAQGVIDAQVDRIKDLLSRSVWSTIKYKFKQWRERNE